MKIKLLTGLMAMVLATGITSCKKKQDLAPLPQNLITEYRIANIDSEEPILGVIDNTDNTITVYVPFYYDADVIDPVVKVSAGAKLKDKLGPVDVLDKTKTYSVTDAAGTTRTYKLNVVIQQVEPLSLLEKSTETTIETYNLNGGTDVSGSFYTMDVNKVKAFLVNKSGQQFSLGTTTTATTISPSNSPKIKFPVYTLSILEIPADIDTGLYHMKVKIRDLQAQMKYPVRLVYNKPQIVTYTLYTVAQGSTFVIKTARETVFHNFKAFRVNVNGLLMELPIVSYNRTEATIKIPDDFPVGNYNQIEADFDGWPILKATISITIKNK